MCLVTVMCYYSKRFMPDLLYEQHSQYSRGAQETMEKPLAVLLFWK